MAKETVVITPYRIGQAHLVGKYDDRNLGVTVLITKDMQVKTSFTPADEKNRFSFTFNEIQRTFSLEYDEESTDLNQTKIRSFLNALALKPDIKIEGREMTPREAEMKFGIAPKFIMKYINGISKVSAISIMERTKAVSVFMDMETMMKQDVAFLFGVNAYRLKDSELINTMIGENFDGILLQPKHMERFIKYDRNNQDTRTRCLMSKANYLDYVKHRHDASTSGYWWAGKSPYNNEFIGKDIQAVIEYFAHNPKMFEWLETEVNKQDRMTSDNVSGIDKAIASQKQKTASVNEQWDAAAKEAKGLGIDPNQFGGDLRKLKAKIGIVKTADKIKETA